MKLALPLLLRYEKYDNRYRTNLVVLGRGIGGFADENEGEMFKVDLFPSLISH